MEEEPNVSGVLLMKDNEIYNTDVENIENVGRKILLTGTCWYELAGLWHQLSAQGYDVYWVPLGDYCIQDCWDLIIVALSAEPVAGWGRHLPWVWELRTQIFGEMVVLVPDRLKKLKMLQGGCSVYSGRESLRWLDGYISTIPRREIVLVGQFRLTDGQRRVLKRLSKRERPLNLKREKRELYYHLARLAKNVGVRDFRMLLMTGLDREIYEMEEKLYGN